MGGNLRYKKSGICSELLALGYVKGSEEYSKEYKRRYTAMRRLSPEVKKKEREQFKAYAKLKGPDWNKERIREWRKANPLRWKAIASKASKNGIHKRFYEKNRDRVLEEKKVYAKERTRKNPAFGLRKAISDAKQSGDLRKLAEVCLTAIVRLDE